MSQTAERVRYAFAAKNIHKLMDRYRKIPITPHLDTIESALLLAESLTHKWYKSTAQEAIKSKNINVRDLVRFNEHGQTRISVIMRIDGLTLGLPRESLAPEQRIEYARVDWEKILPELLQIP